MFFQKSNREQYCSGCKVEEERKRTGAERCESTIALSALRDAKILV